MLICATCAVERDEPTPGVCPICTDERQYVPEDGQKWLTLDRLAQEGQQTLLKENEPGLIAIKTEPKFGIRLELAKGTITAVESPTKASSVHGRQQVSVHALVRGRKQA